MRVQLQETEHILTPAHSARAQVIHHLVHACLRHYVFYDRVLYLLYCAPYRHSLLLYIKTSFLYRRLAAVSGRDNERVGSRRRHRRQRTRALFICIHRGRLGLFLGIPAWGTNSAHKKKKKHDKGPAGAVALSSAKQSLAVLQLRTSTSCEYRSPSFESFTP